MTDSFLSYLVLGKTLSKIKDQNLYKIKGFESFADYCSMRWDLTPTRANHYIRLTRTYENLKKNIVQKVQPPLLPANESQLSHLARLSEKKQLSAWREILRTAPKAKSGKAKITARLVKKAVDSRLNRNGSGLTSLIKPSDNWNFQTTVYLPEGVNGHGYISGEVYANAFWYFVKEGDLVVDPMAGSGLAKHVYDDRAKWMGKDHCFDFKVRLFDLTPQKSFIKQHDLLTGFPIKHPDYIFMDIPYFGMVKGQYSNNKSDLANIMDWSDYCSALRKIAINCYEAQRYGKLCTVMASNSREVANGKRYMLTQEIAAIWEAAGYCLFDKSYSPRHIQINKSPGMAILNNKAKKNRVMLTDITEVLTFKKARK